MLSLQALFVPFLLLAGLFGPGWLGVYLSEDDSGRVMVSEVVANSPAQKAGVKSGDVILALDGKSTTSVEALIEAIKTREAGSKVKLTLGRDSGDTVIEVTLGDAETGPRTVNVTPPARATETTKVAEAKVTEQKNAAEKAAEAKKADGAAVKTGAAPGVETKPTGRPYLGLALEETDRGVMITEVLKDGPAGKAKVATGQLLAIGDVKVKTLADMDKAMAGVQPGQTLKLTVQGRAVETFEVVVGSKGDGERKSEVVAAQRRTENAEQAERAKAALRDAERAKANAERAKAEAERAKAEEAAKAAKRAGVVKLDDVTESKPAAAAEDPRAALRAARGKQPLALVFGASWDASTKALRKSFDDEKVKAALGERKVLWFDTDRFGALADEFKVQQIPHIVLLDKSGKQQRAIEGFQPPEALAAVVGAGEFVGGQAPIPVRLPARARTAPAAAAQPDMKPEAKPETKAEPKPQARTSDRDLEQEIRELRMEIRELRQTLRELLNERRR